MTGSRAEDGGVPLRSWVSRVEGRGSRVEGLGRIDCCRLPSTAIVGRPVAFFGLT